MSTPLRTTFGLDIRLADYSEHAITGITSEVGAAASAAAYVELRLDGAKPLFGVGISPNIVTASLQAVTSAVNRRCGHPARDSGQPVGRPAVRP